jgi:hypothetical protein
MNRFVNPKKRGISLPKGCKDLLDVLRRVNEKPLGDLRPSDVAKRLLAECTKRLQNPDLSPEARARIERALQEIKEQMRKAS